jgi:hypothetical protein
MAISSYCERLDLAFWAEPLNAVTNAAFLVAGLAALRLIRRDRPADRALLGLSALVMLIGVGSFLFHTVPARWSLLADVVPIQLFAVCYVGLALRRMLGLSPRAALAGSILFLAACLGLSAVLAPVLPPPIRGAAGYAGFLAGLFGMALAVWLRGVRVTARRLALCGAVFTLSLGFRSLDGALCAQWPAGLHWAWHLLNGLVLYLLLRAAVLHARDAA